MGRRDQILSTIMRIRAAGLDADKRPDALAADLQAIAAPGGSLKWIRSETDRSPAARP